MTTVAYRDRTTGRYPITLAEVRASVNMLFGPEPTQDVLDAANVDAVLSTPPPPYDAATHALSEGAPIMEIPVEGEPNIWFQTWQVTALPPPPPVVLAVGEFVSRFRIPEEDNLFGALDDAMMLESRLVRRNWLNDRYEFTQGDAFWTIIDGHLDDLGVSVERKAQLFARQNAAAQMETADAGPATD